MPYPDDPRVRAEAIALLGATWPSVPEGIASARRWGSEWLDVSTPFVSEHEGEVVSLVGVITMPLRVAGRDVEVAGVHGVCTKREQRRRGHFRRAMEEALAFVDARFETAILWSDQLELYAPFGFRLEAESARRGAAPPGMGSGPRGRRLDLDDAADLAVLRDRLARRAPVSERLATRDPGWHFLIDVGLMGRDAPGLWLVPELDAILAIDEQPDTTKLVDVVASAIPAIERVLPHLPPARELEIQLDTATLGDASLPRAPHSNDVERLVRGPWLAGDAPLSPLTQC